MFSDTVNLVDKFVLRVIAGSERQKVLDPRSKSLNSPEVVIDFTTSIEFPSSADKSVICILPCQSYTNL